ncbi:hypothetical protein [Celeribacter neptunius]|nr:hypothetical protein [Celeribacter neptunius]
MPEITSRLCLSSLSLATGLLALSLAAPLRAEPVFEKTGWIGLGAASGQDEEFWLGGDTSWATTGDGLGLSFGGFGTVGRDHETYAALTYSLSDGNRIALGNPRPAFDLFARPQISDVLLPEALSRSATGFSRLTDGTLTKNDYLPYGLSYGGAEMAVSLHYVEDYDVTVLSAGGSWALNNWRLESAVELVEGDGRAANAKLQGSVALGPGTFTGSLFYNEANDAPGAVEMAYRHPLNDRIALTELVSVPFEAPEDGVALLGANVYLRGSASLDLSAGYSGGADGGDGLAGAALRLDF